MNQPTQIDQGLQSLFDEILSDWRARRGESPHLVELDMELWKTLSDAGITTLLSGDHDAGWLEAAALLRTTARHAAPVPLAEHDALAGWLLVRAELPIDDVPRTAAVLDAEGRARRVPWASLVDSIVVAWRDADGAELVADVPRERFRIERGWDLAGQPRDTVCIALDELAGSAAPEGTIEQLELRGSLARCAQSLGAMERALELSIEHASARRQFGRPIAAFQAVQQLIARSAGETALARAAVDGAVLSTLEDGLVTERSAGIARSVVGHAASRVARDTHQVLGAIGTTFEHELREHTRPLLAWQQEFGSVASWDRRLTLMLVDSDAGAWEFVAPVGG